MSLSEPDSPAPDTAPITLSELASALRKCLLTGKGPDLPEEALADTEVGALVEYVKGVQTCLDTLSRGDCSSPLPIKGYTGGMIKRIQSNFQHLIWKANQIAEGNFSQKIDFMGEMSEAFNTMAVELEKAHNRLESQKRHLAVLSDNLRKEIDARIAVEEDLRREELRMRKLASTDPLTGIANRRAFFQQASKEIQRCASEKLDCHLAMTDLDHFKTLNDNYGHKMGDKALIQISKLINAHLHSHHLVGRYGGDEFIILLPETLTSEVSDLLEDIKDAIVSAGVCPEEMDPPVSISCGFARINCDLEPEKALEEAILRADAAMYSAKQHGRNRVAAA